MEHSREYYQSFVTFLELACREQRRDFSCEDGREIVGAYWSAICKELKAEGLAGVNCGNMHIHDFMRLEPIIADCRAKVEQMDKAEHDRELRNRESIENISYGKKAYTLAEKSFRWNKGNIIFTSIVAAGQIIQWIVLIWRWLSNP